ncbi:hypothetical protein D3C86_1066700 [compost metagenome]
MRDDPAAQRPCVQALGQAIGGPQLDHVPGSDGAERLVRFSVGVVVVGVAGRQLPAGRDFARQFRLEALADHLALVDVAAIERAPRPGVVRVFRGGAVLFDPVDREGGVGAATKDIALQTQFVVLGLDRIQRRAGLWPLALHVLRLEGLGVAGVGGPVFQHVVGQPDVGSEDIRFLQVTQALPVAAAIGFPGVVLVGIVGVPAAGDQVHRVGQAEARHAIEGALFGGVVAVLQRRSREVRGRPDRVEDIDGFSLVAHALRGIGLSALVVRAEQERMPAPEGIDGAFHVHVQRQPVHVVHFGVGVQVVALAGDRIHAAEAKGAGVVAPHVRVHRVGVDRPVVVEAVLHLGIDLAGAVPRVGPARDQRRPARQAQVLAVGVARQAREVGNAVAVLVACAQGQQGPRRQVELQGAVHEPGAHLGRVVEEVAVLIGQPGTAAQRGAGVQRAGDVAFDAVVVPAAHGAGETSLRLGLGALAHQIDGAAGVAGAGEQAVHAAQELDVVILRHVDLADGAEPVHRGFHRRAAIDLHVADGESARIEVGVVAQRRARAVAGALQGQAGGLVQHIGQGRQVLVFDALACDHRHGVRDLAQFLAFGHRHTAGGVRAGAFGRRVAIARHRHGR